MWATIDEFGRLETREGKYTLEELQAWVGGDVEHLSGPYGLDVWVNEEGKYQGLRWNPAVTEWMAGRIMPGDRIVGKVAITGLNEKRLAKVREDFPGILQIAL